MRPLLLLVCASGAAFAAGQTGTQVLKFSQPAENWEKQSLPIGNGTIGANTKTDKRIQIKAKK